MTKRKVGEMGEGPSPNLNTQKNVARMKRLKEEQPLRHSYERLRGNELATESRKRKEVRLEYPDKSDEELKFMIENEIKSYYTKQVRKGKTAAQYMLENAQAIADEDIQVENSANSQMLLLYGPSHGFHGFEDLSDAEAENDPTCEALMIHDDWHQSGIAGPPTHDEFAMIEEIGEFRQAWSETMAPARQARLLWSPTLKSVLRKIDYLNSIRFNMHDIPFVTENEEIILEHTPNTWFNELEKAVFRSLSLWSPVFKAKDGKNKVLKDRKAALEAPGPSEF